MRLQTLLALQQIAHCILQPEPACLATSEFYVSYVSVPSDGHIQSGVSGPLDCKSSARTPTHLLRRLVDAVLYERAPPCEVEPPSLALLATPRRRRPPVVPPLEHVLQPLLLLVLEVVVAVVLWILLLLPLLLLPLLLLLPGQVPLLLELVLLVILLLVVILLVVWILDLGRDLV